MLYITLSLSVVFHWFILSSIAMMFEVIFVLLIDGFTSLLGNLKPHSKCSMNEVALANTLEIHKLKIIAFSMQDRRRIT
jgi:uncharacterized membrane protein